MRGVTTTERTRTTMIMKAGALLEMIETLGVTKLDTDERTRRTMTRITRLNPMRIHAVKETRAVGVAGLRTTSGLMLTTRAEKQTRDVDAG